MLIYFLRHGDASSSSRFHDNERPLTDLGHNQALCIGKFLLQNKAQINIILTSPLIRAYETGIDVRSVIHTPRIETTECLVNGTHPQQLFKQIKDFGVESILLVGHEPFLSDTISLLLSGDAQTDIIMKKCSLALVEIRQPLHPGTGTLQQLIHVDSISHFIKS